MRNVIADTAASLRFLSRLPVRPEAPEQVPDFARSAYAFPLAGLVIAVPGAIVLWLADLAGLGSLVAVFLACAVMIIVTGALHEDGLADTADGVWGGHSKERRLEIMRDSHIGTYGVLALIVCVLLRVVLLAEVLSVSGAFKSALILLAAASLSRLAIVQPWVLLPPARPVADGPEPGSVLPSAGLSARYGVPDKSALPPAMIAALPALGLLFYCTGAWGTLVALFMLELVVLTVMGICRKHIGGHTGDTLGATQQLSELGLLLGLVCTM